MSDTEFKDGNRGGQCTASAFNQISQSAIYKEDTKTVSLTVCGGSYGGAVSASYYMTDKAGHLCRFTMINKCNTLQATDYKDPPVILTRTIS